MEGRTAFLNKFGPPFFIINLFTIGIYGILVAMPTLYHNETVLFIMQVVAGFGLGQVLMCWYVTRNVDTGYSQEGSTSLQVLTNIHTEDGMQSEKKELNGNVSWMPSRAVPNDVSSIAPTDEHRQAKQDDSRFMMDITTVDANGLKEKKFYPYWSWSPCSRCRIFRPPRCHHCLLCRKCILKRDHHCFFTGSCIGAKNQGHFVVFMFWAVFVTLFGTLHMLPYTYWEILPVISFVDFVPPISILRVTLGYIPYFIPFLVFLFWTLLILVAFSSFMFYEIINVTLRGVTSFELTNGIEVNDCRNVSERLRSALGDKWLLTFFVLPARDLVGIVDGEDTLALAHIKPE